MDPADADKLYKLGLLIPELLARIEALEAAQNPTENPNAD